MNKLFLSILMLAFMCNGADNTRLTDQEIIHQLAAIEDFKRCAEIDIRAFQMSMQAIRAGQYLRRLNQDKKELIPQLSDAGYPRYIKYRFPRAFYPSNDTGYMVYIRSSTPLPKPLVSIIVEYLYTWETGSDMHVHTSDDGSVDHITFRGAEHRTHILSSVMSRHSHDDNIVGSFKFLSQSTLLAVAATQLQNTCEIEQAKLSQQQRRFKFPILLRR